MYEAPGMDVITILKITQTSEHFLKLDYISPSHGLSYGLLRPSKKNNQTIPPPTEYRYYVQLHTVKETQCHLTPTPD